MTRIGNAETDVIGIGTDEVSGVRARLIDAAIAALNEHGRFDLTVSDVARRAGLSTGAIYSSFVNREGLLAAAYETRMRRQATSPFSLGVVATQVFSERSPDAAGLYSSLGIFCTAEQEANRVRTLDALIASLYSAATRDHVTELFVPAIAALKDQVVVSQQAGHTRSDLDPMAIALGWLAAGFGSACVSGLMRTTESPEVDDATRQALWRALLAFNVEDIADVWDEPAPATHGARDFEPTYVDQERSDAGRKVLAAAAQLLQSEGDVELTIASVAKLAGVSPGAVYSQFGSRRNLIAQAYLQMMPDRHARPELAITVTTTQYGAASVNEDEVIAHAIWLSHREVRDRRLASMQAEVEAYHNADLRPEIQIRNNHFSRDVGRVIEKSQHDGFARRGVDPYAVSEFWLATSLGLAVLEAFYADLRTPQFECDLVNVSLILMLAHRRDRWARLVTLEEFERVRAEQVLEDSAHTSTT